MTVPTLTVGVSSGGVYPAAGVTCARTDPTASSARALHPVIHFRIPGSFRLASCGPRGADPLSPPSAAEIEKGGVVPVNGVLHRRKRRAEVGVSWAGTMEGPTRESPLRIA